MMKPKRALITGASSGLGESFAKKLATQGVNLILVARRHELLEKLQRELQEKFNITVEIIPLDLSLVGSAKTLLEFSTRNGPVDLLINNAGVGPYRSFVKSSWKDHQTVIDLNVSSLTELCYLFSSHMLEHKQPSVILNVASVASFQPLPKMSVYCASKSYVRMFTEILRYELRATNVKVSCLCPGGTETDFLKNNNQRLKRRSVLMDREKVVDAGLTGALSGKRLIIPGVLNKMSSVFAELLPFNVNLPVAARAMDFAVDEEDL